MFYFCRLLIFSKLTFSKNSFKTAFRVPNSLDPEKAGNFVVPNLVPNCFQKLSADDSSRPRLHSEGSKSLNIRCNN